ncbi:MAG: hypothetical protein GXO79_07220 [Chlorobi bacterium]|nr:hypothetical protein [Chlorobiota bacterium]
MTYKNDLYISFPLSKENTIALDWINNFSSFLSILLEKLLKRTVTIVLSDEKNSKEINESALFIALFNADSNNKNFQNEIRKIVALCEKDLQNRFYKVFNTKQSLADFPDALKPLFDYNFYTIDTETGKIIEFRELKGLLEEKLFWLKLVDLAYDIYNNLILLNKPKLTEKNSETPKKTIYLAETNEDQRINKDIIKRELLQYGYHVIPEKQLTINDRDLNETINKNLSKACMSIHIISEDYAQTGSEENSICAIQNSLASKYYSELEKKGQNKSFNRIIWISPDLNLKNEKQRNNIEQLKQSEEALYGAEVVQTPIELLKTIIHNRLNEDKHKGIEAITPIEQDGNVKSIYLICDKTDIENIKPIQEYFRKKHLSIFNSDFTGSEYELLKKHKQKLISADIVFIYYNNNQEWLVSKVKDIIKSPGFGRTKSFISKVIYFQNSKKPTLDKFTKENFLILSDEKNFTSKTLDPIITKL